MKYNSRNVKGQDHITGKDINRTYLDGCERGISRIGMAPSQSFLFVSYDDAGKWAEHTLGSFTFERASSL